jgi:hypothetical protein
MNFGTLWGMFGPRVVGTAASLLSGYVFAKTKGTVSVDPAQVVELAGTMIGTYALAHTATSVKVNPAAAASPALIEQGKLDNTELNKIADIPSSFPQSKR